MYKVDDRNSFGRSALGEWGADDRQVLSSASFALQAIGIFMGLKFAFSLFRHGK